MGVEVEVEKGSVDEFKVEVECIWWKSMGYLGCGRGG